MCVVGDDDQSIYSWRGASFKNIAMFEEDFPGMAEIKLEQNYRSTSTILAAANGLISRNSGRKEKSLWSGRGEGQPIELHYPESEIAEARLIAGEIKALMASETRRYHDFGVLTRTNSLGRNIEEAFLAQDIPYKVSGGTSFFQRKEIKDVISYMRVIANPDDDLSLLRIINTPARGIGRAAVSALGELAKKNKTSIWDAVGAMNLARGEGQQRLFEGAAQTELELFAELVESLKADMFEKKGAARDPGAEDGPDGAGFLDDAAGFLDGAAGFLDGAAGPGGAGSGGERADHGEGREGHGGEREANGKRRGGGKAGKGKGRGWSLSQKTRALVERIDYWSHLVTEHGQGEKEEKKALWKFRNIEHFVRMIENWERDPDSRDTGLYAWLNRISLITRDDGEADALGKVSLMTIHSAKGLEFPVVFIAGAEEGLIPHERGIEEAETPEEAAGNLEEERRLFYVAITRARERLYITCCQKRRRLQSSEERSPSPFLEEIPANLLRHNEPKQLSAEEEEALAGDMLRQIKARLGRA